MGEPDFLRSPFEIVAELLTTLFDPHADFAARQAAIGRLEAMDRQFLASLAMDGDWQFVLNALAQDELVGDMPGDGAWSTPAGALPGEEAFALDETADTPPAPPVVPVIAPVIAFYTADLQRLNRDDQALPGQQVVRMILPGAPNPGDAPSAIAAQTAAATASYATPTEAFARALPWTMHGLLPNLALLDELWPDQLELKAAFWDEVIRNDAGRGIPYRVARAITTVIGGRPDRQSWFDRTVTWMDEYLERELFDFLPVEALAAVHFELRLSIAERLRYAEITDPAFVATMEFVTTVRLLRAAMVADFRDVWAEVGGQVDRATGRILHRDGTRDLCADRTFHAVLRQPDAATVAHLRPERRQALKLANSLRVSSARLRNHGPLWVEGES